METKRWTVQIYLSEHGDDTFAKAVLTTRDGHLAGAGHARRNPVDPSVPEIGDELATARALADLADKLLVITSRDIAQVAPPAERNSLW